MDIKTEKRIPIGGQAVIEGVMMRSPKYISTVVRRTDNSFTDKTFLIAPLTDKNKIFKLPIIRGAIGLFDTLKIGIQTLNWSANIAIQDEEAQKDNKEKAENVENRKKSFSEKFIDIFGTTITLLIALGIFMYIPYFLTSLLKKVSTNQFFFNLTAGAIRIIFLVSYMLVISMFKDVRRLFEYHGAEHKSIFAFEKKLPLTIENVKAQTRFHPRCGTSFILIVAIITIFIYAVIDSIIYHFSAYPNLFARIATHLSLIPIVGGISYEILKFSDKHIDNPFISQLIKPGLWLQLITTSEPDNSQIEVAIESIKLSTEYLNEEE